MLCVLVCHWGEDLTGNNLLKELFSIVREGGTSRVIPVESSCENEIMKCFCRFAKYFIDVTLAFITKIDSVYNYNLSMSCCVRRFYFSCHKATDW